MASERIQAIEVNRRTHLSMDEFLDILRIARDSSTRDWAILVVIFRHALRSCEAASLRWSDISWSDGTVKIQRAKGGMLTEQPLFRTKGAPLLDEVAALKAWKAGQKRELGNPYVFTTQKSIGHIRRETISRMFRQYAKLASGERTRAGKAPIPESCWHVHVIRHTRITVMVNTPGVDLWDCKALAGWAKLETVLHYAHHDQRKACEEAERSVVEALS